MGPHRHRFKNFMKMLKQYCSIITALRDSSTAPVPSFSLLVLKDMLYGKNILAILYLKSVFVNEPNYKEGLS